jgi:hypothetical protein
MTAFALRISDIKDVDSLASLTKECFDCDEDNPKAHPKASCPTCKGQGRQVLAVLEIVRELREPPPKARRRGFSDDMGDDESMDEASEVDADLLLSDEDTELTTDFDDISEDLLLEY